MLQRLLMEGGVRCKKMGHTGLLDIAVVYQHSVAYPGMQQHAWNKHNEHRTSMMLFWQADRFCQLSRSRTSRWASTVPLSGNLNRGPRRPCGAHSLLCRLSSPSKVGCCSLWRGRRTTAWSRRRAPQVGVGKQALDEVLPAFPALKP